MYVWYARSCKLPRSSSPCRTSSSSTAEIRCATSRRYFSATFWPLVSGILYQDVCPSEIVASYPQWHRRAAAAPRHAGAPSHPTAARPCCQDLSTNAYGDTDSERPSLVTLCKFMHRIRHMTSWLHIPSWYRATERWPSPCPDARPATALDDMTTYHYRASHDGYKRTPWMPDSLTTASCLQWEMIYMIHILYMRIYLWRLVYDIWYIEYMMYDMYERYARYHMCEIYIYIYDVYTIYMICIRTVMSDIWYMMYMIWSWWWWWSWSWWSWSWSWPWSWWWWWRWW